MFSFYLITSVYYFWIFTSVDAATIPVDLSHRESASHDYTLINRLLNLWRGKGIEYNFNTGSKIYFDSAKNDMIIPNRYIVLFKDFVTDKEIQSHLSAIVEK